jgi:MFS family permease
MRARRITDSFHKIKETFDWKWVFVGVLSVVVGNTIAYLALRSIINNMIKQQERVMTAAMLIASVALVVYFLGGVLVGRMSKNRTVKEPAVAAVLALFVIFVLQLMLGMVNVIGLVLGAPFCFGVAYLGGLVGEKWQRISRRR